MNRIVWHGAATLALLGASVAGAATFELVSLRSNGTPPSSYGDGSDPPAITPDGRYVVFTASSTTLVTPNASGYQIYLRDRQTGVTELISVNMTGGGGNSSSGDPTVSDDGCRVAFQSFSTDLVPASSPTPGTFVRDRCASPPATSLVNVSSSGVVGNGASHEGRISGNGRKVVFTSNATNIAPLTGSGYNCLFMRDLVAGTTTPIAAPGGGCMAVATPDVSADGTRVAFWSLYSPGTSNYVNGVWQIYVYDSTAPSGSQLQIASANAAGQPQYRTDPGNSARSGEGASTVTAPAISPDGGYVAFRSRGFGLDSSDGGGTSHVFVKELATGAIVKVSVSSNGVLGNGESSGSGEGYRPGLSRYANVVTFLTSATNLAPETGGFAPNVVARNPWTGQTIGFTANQTLSGVPNITAGGGLIVAYSGYQLDTNFASRGMFVFSGMATRTSDLSVTQSPAPNPAQVGKDVLYTLTVTNGGPDAATAVTLVDVLPAGTTFIWASPGCANAAGTVTCNLGTLANGASVPVRLVVRPVAVGSLTNSASVDFSGGPDPNLANNNTSASMQADATPAAQQVQRYRLYSDVTKEHHFTTDLNEYTVLGNTGGVWIQEGTVGKVLNNPGSFNGVAAVPYYRLYDNGTRWHHWTTDANEYYTLGFVFSGWNMEGVDGYIFPTQASGTVQLYRLNYPALGALHHWTIDPVEYGELIARFGWIGEPGAGFVIP